MKYIGQHIYDLVSRFRNDVYLEDISTGTIASGAHLGLDSNNKIVKAADGTGLSGTSTVTPTSGDFLATLDSDGATEQKTTTDALATLYAGTGLTAAGGRMGVDASQSQITTLAGLTTIGATGINTLISSDDIQWYNAVNDGNPQLSIGASDAERFTIQPVYDSGAQTLYYVKYDTIVASGTADKGLHLFRVDETSILTIRDAGLNLYTGKGIAINGTDILTDSSGTATLSNIDALDATTEATIESAIDTLSNLTTTGTIGTGVWQGTAIAQAYIAGDAINGDKIADDAIDSEHYADGSIDTAHIADDQVTFAKAVGMTPNIYGSIIKVLPSDFMANEEPGVTKTLQFVDNDASGIKPGDNNTELLAFVSIPETMKATHVDVYADANLAFSAYELDIHQSVGDISAASKGTGTCNTTLDITDVNATATNYLLIQVITVSKADRVWGAKVTIAAQ